MNTWTSRRAAAALAFLTLGACDATLPGSTSKPLSQARMAGGAVMLVAPSGFCIDQSSLQPRFALMARCDTLGAPKAAAGAPPALITISLSPSPAGAGLPAANDTARAAELIKVESPRQEPALITFRAQGPVPVKGMSPLQWRANARIGGHVAGIALYGPPDGRAISDEGRDILQALVQRSVAATRAAAPGVAARPVRVNSFE